MKVVIYPETQAEFRALAKPHRTPNQTVVGQIASLKPFKGFQLEVDILLPDTKDPRERLRDRLDAMAGAAAENGYPEYARAVEECLDELISDGLAAPHK
ncbi:hypothetical protein [Vibrio phage vB_VpS_PG28]|nr:hypothetical protein [Vibrio phage vB_VpS_PG28]